MKRAATFLVTLACSMLAPAFARAQPVGSPGPDTPAQETPDAFIDRQMKLSWREGVVRTFAAATIDVGYLYLKPRLTLGYGKPFSSWVGIDLNPIVSATEVAGYAGLHLVYGPFDIRGGGRYNYPFDHDYLVQQSAYGRLDLESTVGSKATYISLEAEINASFKAGPGNVIGTASAFYLTGVPAGFDIYEETLHTIARPPLVLWGRGGYVFRFGYQKQHGIGLVTDVLDSPDRGFAHVRAGVIMNFTFSHHFELRGSFVPTVWSRDTLGLAGGDFTELGVRYRWATGD